MYLSRVILDENRRETLRLLASPEFVHGAVEQGFSGPRQRNLWRLDWLSGDCCLLVLSQTAPDFTELVNKYGFSEKQPLWESKDYTPLLTRLQTGQTWRFRLKANPVYSPKQEGEKRGKVQAHVTPSQQKKWLTDRAEKSGFLLSEDSFEVVNNQWQRFEKPGGRLVSLRTATYEGELRIADLSAFRETLTQGLGRAKAFGCGLMTLARAGGGRVG